jgi:hypothetical protein
MYPPKDAVAGEYKGREPCAWAPLAAATATAARFCEVAPSVSHERALKGADGGCGLPVGEAGKRSKNELRLA